MKIQPEIGIDYFFIILITFMILFSSIFMVMMLDFTASSWFFKKYRDNDEIKELIQESIHFYTEELGIENKPTINLLFKWPHRIFFDTHGYIQKTLGTENEKYHITIYLNHSKYSILETVAHEMIHLKQYNSGDLSLSKSMKSAYKYDHFWRGVDHTDTDYEDRPWEIEAFKKEDALSKKFLKHKGLRKPILLKIYKRMLSI